MRIGNCFIRPKSQQLLQKICLCALSLPQKKKHSSRLSPSLLCHYGQISVTGIPFAQMRFYIDYKLYTRQMLNYISVSILNVNISFMVRTNADMNLNSDFGANTFCMDVIPNHPHASIKSYIPNVG